jgi:hypothetical protein
MSEVTESKRVATSQWALPNEVSCLQTIQLLAPHRTVQYSTVQKCRWVYRKWTRCCYKRRAVVWKRILATCKWYQSFEQRDNYIVVWKRILATCKWYQSFAHRAKGQLHSCPCVRMHQRGSHWVDFCKIWYFGTLIKICREKSKFG